MAAEVEVGRASVEEAIQSWVRKLEPGGEDGNRGDLARLSRASRLDEVR